MHGQGLLANLTIATMVLLASCGNSGSHRASATSEASASTTPNRLPATNTGPRRASADPVTIRFDSLKLEDGLRLTITVQGDADGSTTFSNVSCCGIKDASRFVRDVQIHASERALPMKRDAAGWRVVHERGVPLSISYRLPPTGVTSIDSGPEGQFQPLVNGAWFHLIGDSALLLPVRGKDDDAVRLSIDASNVAASRTFVSSFGPGPALREALVTRSQVRRALYLGGAIHLELKETAGDRVAIAYSGMRAGFPGNDLTQEVLGIVDAVRGFFRDTQPWYLVSVHGGMSQNPKIHIGGGTGLTDSFVMFVASDLDFADSEQREQFRWVLAHEYIHEWIGLTVRVAGLPGSEKDDASVYWFSEGVTDFYTMRLLTRSGLQQPGLSLGVLNDRLRRYAGNRRRNLSAKAAGPLFWSDPDGEQIPYLRGYLAAWYADLALLRVRGGGQGLDRAILALVKRAESDPDYRVDTGFLASYLGNGMSAADAAFFRNFVVSGGEAPLHAEAFQPCLVRENGTLSKSVLQLDFADPRNKACFRH